MPLSTAYLDELRDAGEGAVVYIGLVDSSDTELSGGSYTRLAVSWTDEAGSVARPSADLTFDVPAGGEVAGWRGYSASTEGTDYGGASLTTETFGSAGTYTLLAASTSIDHDAA